MECEHELNKASKNKFLPTKNIRELSSLTSLFQRFSFDRKTNKMNCKEKFRAH